MPSKPKLPFYFNAIFHGPFIFVFYGQRVEVLGTNVKEHIVGAGTFLKERPCTPGNYSVVGIWNQNRTMKPINRQKHAVLNADPKKFQILKDAYYKFILPTPSLVMP